MDLKIDIPNIGLLDRFRNLDDPYRDGTLSILVGGEKEGFRDGELALFNNPYGIIVDPKTQYLYICDYDNERIRCVTQKDSMGNSSDLNHSYFTKTIAGIGQKGYMVGRADECKINSPNGITFNGDGNIVFTDQNNLVLRVIKNGQLQSLTDKKVSSSILSCPCSVIYCDRRKAFFVTDYKNNMIARVDEFDGNVSIFVGSNKKESGCKDAKGLEARFNCPCGITLDRSDMSLYVTDQGNHKIRRISEDGTVTTIAGSGIQGYKDGESMSSQWSCPNGITFDANNRNLLVVDYWNLKIRSISLDKKVVTSLNGSLGKVTFCNFKNPYGITLDSIHGVIYVTIEHAVLKMKLPYYNQLNSVNKIKLKRENIISTLDSMLKEYDIDHNIELQNIIEEKNKLNAQLELELEKKNETIIEMEMEIQSIKKKSDLYLGKGLDGMNSKELEQFEKEIKLLAKKVKKKLRSLSDKSNECSVCCDRKINTVLLDCGHACCCSECATKILESDAKLCPVCRCEILKIHTIFLS